MCVCMPTENELMSPWSLSITLRLQKYPNATVKYCHKKAQVWLSAGPQLIWMIHIMCITWSYCSHEIEIWRENLRCCWWESRMKLEKPFITHSSNCLCRRAHEDDSLLLAKLCELGALWQKPIAWVYCLPFFTSYHVNTRIKTLPHFSWTDWFRHQFLGYFPFNTTK